jgi:hypothetical protein
MCARRLGSCRCVCVAAGVTPDFLPPLLLVCPPLSSQPHAHPFTSATHVEACMRARLLGSCRCVCVAAGEAPDLRPPATARVPLTEFGATGAPLHINHSCRGVNIRTTSWLLSMRLCGCGRVTSLLTPATARVLPTAFAPPHQRLISRREFAPEQLHWHLEFKSFFKSVQHVQVQFSVTVLCTAEYYTLSSSTLFQEIVRQHVSVTVAFKFVLLVVQLEDATYLELEGRGASMKTAGSAGLPLAA